MGGREQCCVIPFGGDWKCCHDLIGILQLSMVLSLRYRNSYSVVMSYVSSPFLLLLEPRWVPAYHTQEMQVSFLLPKLHLFYSYYHIFAFINTTFVLLLLVSLGKIRCKFPDYCSFLTCFSYLWLNAFSFKICWIDDWKASMSVS